MWQGFVREGVNLVWMLLLALLFLLLGTHWLTPCCRTEVDVCSCCGRILSTYLHWYSSLRWGNPSANHLSPNHPKFCISSGCLQGLLPFIRIGKRRANTTRPFFVAGLCLSLCWNLTAGGYVTRFVGGHDGRTKYLITGGLAPVLWVPVTGQVLVKRFKVKVHVWFLLFAYNPQ